MTRNETTLLVSFRNWTARQRAVARWGRRITFVLVVGWGLLLAARCHLPRHTVPSTADSTSAVYFVQHGWHAGIAVRRADVLHEVDGARAVRRGRDGVARQVTAGRQEQPPHDDQDERNASAPASHGALASSPVLEGDE